MQTEYHIPVLLKESVDGLIAHTEGCYADITFGGGGHSREILGRLGKTGALYAIDQDADAAANAQTIQDDRFHFISGNFRFCRGLLRERGVEALDGLLGDLGVSSHHFDAPERGFSFRFNAPLDMRMNQRNPLTAATLLNTFGVEDLTRIFRQYGELSEAYKMALSIDQFRKNKPLVIIEDLLEAIQKQTPKFNEHKFYAKVFQAIRIEVNAEMRVLEQFLYQLPQLIKPGGKVAIITYHSLEDRLVKNFFKCGNTEGKTEQDMYGKSQAPFLPEKKIILPSETEIQTNTRSRSAKLRIATRTNHGETNDHTKKE